MILKKHPGNSTVIYKFQNLGKFHTVNFRRRNDFAMWLAVIKKAKNVYGLQEMLGYHRVRSGSVSYKKSTLLKYQWIVYRKMEKLSVIRSIWLMLYKIISMLSIK